MNHYPHHIGDFNNATRHLTRVERSLYRDLIDLYYDTEQPLPADDFDRLARRVLAVSDEEKTALHAVLAEFFTLEADAWTHERCDAEIARYRSQIGGASRAGKASAEARAQRKVNKRSTRVEPALSERTTNQNQNQNQNQKKDNPKATAAPLPEWLDAEVWTDFLAHRKELKKPMGPVAVKACFEKLGKLRATGHDPTPVLKQSMESGWAGVFEIKGNRGGGNGNIHEQRAAAFGELTGGGRRAERDITPDSVVIG